MADDDELAKIIREARPKTLGVVRAKELASMRDASRNKAVLFVPEGASLDSDDLMVEIVNLNAATMAAMVARRC